MKALFAIFAVAAGLALAGSAPAAAKPVSKSDLRCLVLDGGNYTRRVVNVCTCTTVANVPKDIRALLKPDASRVSLHCPAGGGTGPVGSRTPPPDDGGHGWSFSKAESSSKFVGVALGGCGGGRGTVVTLSSTQNGGASGACAAGIFATQRNKSVGIGDGAAAGAGAGAGGGAYTGSFGGYNTSSTAGGTGGSSCAGSGCGGGGGGPL
jgi:hypothetical protein